MNIPPNIPPIFALSEQSESLPVNHTVLGKRTRKQLSSVEKSPIEYFNKIYKQIIKSDNDTLLELYPKLHYHYMCMNEDEKKEILDKKTYAFNKYLALLNLK
jgi:hypothetical protein